MALMNISCMVKRCMQLVKVMLSDDLPLQQCWTFSFVQTKGQGVVEAEQRFPCIIWVEMCWALTSRDVNSSHWKCVSGNPYSFHPQYAWWHFSPQFIKSNCINVLWKYHCPNHTCTRVLCLAKQIKEHISWLRINFSWSHSWICSQKNGKLGISNSMYEYLPGSELSYILKF